MGERKVLKEISDTLLQWVSQKLSMRGSSCFARHTWLRTLAEDLSTPPHRSIPRSSREKKPLLPSVTRVQFQMAERLKVLTMISHKFHVFWRRTMSTGSLFFLCYKTPQECDNQETMTSCILLVKYYWVFPTFFDEFYSVFFFCFFICFPPRWLMKFTSLSGPQSTVKNWLLGGLIYKLVVAGQKQ